MNFSLGEPIDLCHSFGQKYYQNKQNCVRTLAQYIIDDLINEQNVFIHFCLDNSDQKRRSRKVKLFDSCVQ